MLHHVLVAFGANSNKESLVLASTTSSEASVPGDTIAVWGGEVESERAGHESLKAVSQTCIEIGMMRRNFGL